MWMVSYTNLPPSCLTMTSPRDIFWLLVMTAQWRMKSRLCSIQKNKPMVSKECALAGNNNFGRVSNHTVAAQIFIHLSVVSSRQQSYDWLRCEGIVCNGNAGLMLGCLFLFCRCISGESGGKKYLHLLGILASTAMESTVSIRL